MNKTTIEWVRNPDGTQGYTWNVVTGCLNHDNGLCKGGGFPCYAYKLANGRLKQRYLANENTVMKCADGYVPMKLKVTEPFHPRFWEERLHEMTKRNDRLYYDGQKTQYPISPRGIFVCDMGDLFGLGVPGEWTEKVLDEIWGNKGYDRFYLLTKQPQNLIKWSPFPENCWVGVTATSYDYFVDACAVLHSLRHKHGTTTYMSLEPLLSWDSTSVFTADWLQHAIDWLIIGACTGTYQEMSELRLKYPDLWIKVGDDKETQQPSNRKWTAQPKIEWVREIVEAADRAGIKVFFKDNLKPILNHPITNPWAFAPNRYDIRQEMPKGEK